MPNLTVQFLQHNSWPISKSNNNMIIKGRKLIQGGLFSVNTPKILINDKNSLNVIITSKLQNWLGKCSLDLQNNFGLISKTFADIINEMKDTAKCKGSDLSAIIYGNHYENWDLLNTIVDTFEAERVNPSLLVGNSNLNSYLRKDKLTIWGEPINNLKLKKDANSLEIQKQVEKVLNCVERPDNIEFALLEDLPSQAKTKIKA